MNLPYIFDNQDNEKLSFSVCQYLPYVRVFKNIKDTNGKLDFSDCRLLVCDEVGVGKTAEMGIIINELRYGELFADKGLHILIVCPAKLKLNWKKELDTLTDVNARVFDKDIKHFYHTTIIGFDELKNYVDNNDKLPLIDVLIVDEAHYLRNDSSDDGNNSGGRAGAVKAIIKKKEQEENSGTIGMMKLFLSGTPIFNSKNDLEALAGIMGVGENSIVTTKTTKAAAHCNDNSYNGGEIKMVTKLPIYELCRIEIRDEYEKNVFFACKSDKAANSDDDWFDDEEDDYELTDPQERMGNYAQYCANSIHYLNSWAERKTSEDEKLNTIKAALEEWRKGGCKDTKLEYLKRLLGYLKKDSMPLKVVIFVEHPETAQYLRQNLAEYEVGILSGSTEKPALETRLFKEAASDYIMICTRAAQEGHNFQFAPYLIHYEFQFTPAAIWQRNGRIDRMGQTQNPHIYYFKTVCMNGSEDVSYDDRYYDILLKKMEDIRENAELIPYSEILPSPGKRGIIDYSNESGEKYVEEYNNIKNEVLKVFDEKDREKIKEKIRQKGEQ